VKSWLFPILLVVLLAASVGCGANTKVETPENPDPAPQVAPKSNMAPNLPMQGKGKGR